MADTTRSLWAQQDRHEGDRQRLFRAVDRWLNAHDADPERVLYPGSWVDVAASFVFEHVTYLDMDRRARRFFGDPDGVRAILAEHGAPHASFEFIAGDYRDPQPLADGSFDLLVSLYAGFVSEFCTRYLRTGGYLLVNPSHGDAALTAIDDRYELVAVVQSVDGTYHVSDADLDRFLEPKRPSSANREAVLNSGRGVAYTVSAFAYLFRRTH